MWTPPAGFAAVPSLADIYEQVRLKNPRSASYKERLGQVLDEAEDWLRWRHREMLLRLLDRIGAAPAAARA